MKRYYFLMGLFLCFFAATAQKNEVDSLTALLQKKMVDSTRVINLNKLAFAYNLFNPAKGLITAQQALELAQKIHFFAGESRALNLMANAYNITGNYNRAMDIYLKQLQNAENRNLPLPHATALMNIGILYTQQLDYKKALPYYRRSDSIISLYKLKTIDYNSFLNLGDLYDRLGNVDSALYFYQKSLIRAQETVAKDKAAIAMQPYHLGASFIGMGNCYVKMKMNRMGLEYYYQALQYLRIANEEDLYCETLSNMARLFETENRQDSALYYARSMLAIAEKDKFQSRILDASGLLANLYKKAGNGDSAFAYLEKMLQVKDSISSRDKIKEFQGRSINEEIRQAEAAEQKRKDRAERVQQLQLLLIGLFIPVFFLLTLLLSRRKIHVKLIRALGIISLLLLFEYLTLLLHPFVLEFTNHTPVYEMLIFVSIAALLIPGHHRIEYWLIERLTHSHRQSNPGNIRIKTSKMKIKRPSP